MWIARNKNGTIWIFSEKPVRFETDGKWVSRIIPKTTYSSVSYHTKIGELNKNQFPNLKWEDEPVEVGLIDLNPVDDESFDDTIVLTRYYKDYEKEHEWFINMLKHQERYKDCTDDEVEEIWKDHIKEEYTLDEIWNTIQCDGFTTIMFRMGRHDHQPACDYVLETKEYIDKKLNNYR